MTMIKAKKNTFGKCKWTLTWRKASSIGSPAVVTTDVLHHLITTNEGSLWAADVLI